MNQRIIYERIKIVEWHFNCFKTLMKHVDNCISNHWMNEILRIEIIGVPQTSRIGSLLLKNESLESPKPAELDHLCSRMHQVGLSWIWTAALSVAWGRLATKWQAPPTYVVCIVCLWQAPPTYIVYIVWAWRAPPTYVVYIVCAWQAPPTYVVYIVCAWQAPPTYIACACLLCV